MKNFKDLNILKYYKNTEDELADAFFNPVLSLSKNYYCKSAYFSLNVLRDISIGIGQIYKNGGKINFLFSYQIEPEVIESIKEGYKGREEIKKRLSAIEEADISDDYRLANLSYLIKIGLCDVKISFGTKERPLDHIKKGFMVDNENNIILYSGSLNMTYRGFNRNIEEINVYMSYDSQNPDYASLVKPGLEEFFEEYNNNSPDVTVIDGSELLDKKIKIADKGKVFLNEEEYFENQVVFDIVSINKEKVIVIKDYTTRRLPSTSYVLHLISTSGFFKDSVCENFYYKKVADFSLAQVDNLKQAFLKDKKYAVNPYEIHYTKRFELREDELRLDLDLRRKLGIDIKNSDYIIDNDSQKNIYALQKLMNEKYMRENHQLKIEQAKAVYFGVALGSSANYSVPGTGKTTMAYALYRYLSSEKKIIDKMLVVCPKSAFQAWRDEYQVCFKNPYEKMLICTDKTEFQTELNLRFGMYSIFVINYESLEGSVAEFLRKKVVNTRTLIVFDEAHRIKKPDGVWAKNCLKFKSLSSYKLILTGTPIPNSYADLFNQFNLLFANEKPFPYSLQYLKSCDNHISNIQDVFFPYFIRITKKDLNINPPNPNDEVSLYSTASPEEEELLSQIRFKYNENRLLLIIRLMQAVSNPRLLLSSDFKDLDLEDEFEDEDEDLNKYSIHDYEDNNDLKPLIEKIGISSKTKKTLDFISNNFRNKKVVVWCLFTKTIDFVTDYINSVLGINAISIYGRDTLTQREEKISQFKNDAECKVLVSNPNTLGESISLHKVCHDAIYLEYGYNLTYLLQSKDRIHRLGISDDQETNYYFAILDYNFYVGGSTYNGSIDKAILKRLKYKEERMIDTIENNNVTLADIGSSEEDVNFIYKELNLNV